MKRANNNPITTHQTLTTKNIELMMKEYVVRCARLRIHLPLHIYETMERINRKVVNKRDVKHKMMQKNGI